VSPEIGPEEQRDEHLIGRLRRHRDRREKAAAEPPGRPWKTVAEVGLLGWLIALPTVGGAFLGHLLDRRYDTGVTWALGFLTLGLAVGFYAYWRAVEAGRRKIDE